MLSLTTTATREHDRTVVTCRLTNTGDAPRLATLSSPHAAVTPSEHPEGTLRVRVPARATVGTGFTTAAPPDAEPLATLDGDEPVPDSPDPARLLDSLGGSRPPRRALVGPESPPDSVAPEWLS
ncbi:hypothetical protein DM867_05055 [Halosegnis rubeus]|uniref:Uncharacterized protein n=1 Tax=Halosegnis rubeus TaxID=2212850 RepID=A0A5N5UCY3_9EURY|nr:hypothetical protein [Halosegnis rubeus]KAB7513498.1 hypothetical protein DP108_12990 [Halosegnis rubeus]KAB7516483.1 hypothetical protein DM867_05055 [Halosegnis rubeus]